MTMCYVVGRVTKQTKSIPPVIGHAHSIPPVYKTLSYTYIIYPHYSQSKAYLQHT